MCCGCNSHLFIAFRFSVVATLSFALFPLVSQQKRKKFTWNGWCMLELCVMVEKSFVSCSIAWRLWKTHKIKCTEWLDNLIGIIYTDGFSISSNVTRSIIPRRFLVLFLFILLEKNFTFSILLLQNNRPSYEAAIVCQCGASLST